MIALGLVGAAFAANPSFPSSPPISIDDAETVEAGHAEINLTVGALAGSAGWGAEAPLVDANLGITPDIHVNAEMPLALGGKGASPEVGLGQAAVAVKLRVLHRDRVQLALHPAVELPPIPRAAIDPGATWSVTLPVVLDVAVGETGAGIGLEVSHTFTPGLADDSWQAMVGFATPLDADTVLMFDYAQEAGVAWPLGEGWFEAGLTRDRLFGSDHLALLASLGRSTQGRTAAMVGVQVGI